MWCFSEIRFVINPEYLVSILLCEEMEDEESILLVGAEQFSLYSGYGGRFKFGPHEDINPTDERKRRCVSNVVDATCFMSSGHIIQYNKKNILTELNKVYCGFRHTITKLLLQICPCGHWGCGMFGGEKQPYSGWLPRELAEMSSTSLLMTRTRRMNRST